MTNYARIYITELNYIRASPLPPQQSKKCDWVVKCLVTTAILVKLQVMPKGPINHLNGDQIVLKSTTPAVSAPMADVGAQKKSAVNLKKKKKDSIPSRRPSFIWKLSVQNYHPIKSTLLCKRETFRYSLHRIAGKGDTFKADHSFPQFLSKNFPVRAVCQIVELEVVFDTC